jgi:hypothetical protein
MLYVLVYQTHYGSVEKYEYLVLVPVDLLDIHQHCIQIHTTPIHSLFHSS